MTFVYFHAHRSPTGKGFNFKVNNLQPLGATFFPFRVDTVFRREA